MAIVWDSIVPPEAITRFARRVPVRQDMVLNRILPDRYVADLEVAVDDVTLTTRAAKFRSFDGPPQRGKRDGFTRRRMKLPPVSQVLGKGELERLQLERVRNAGGNTDAIEQAIYDDVEINVRSVQARVELARGDVLTDGILDLSYSGENGLQADFGVPGSNLVTPATPWSTIASADILGNLRTWSQLYRDINGFMPGGFVTSEDTVFLMLQNAAIRALFAANGATPAQITQEQLNAFLGNYRLPGLAWTYDSQFDVDGVATRAVPADRVIFIPPPGIELGVTYWGLSATALEMVRERRITFREAPGIVGVVDVDTSPPYKEDTFVDATVLPVVSNPRALMVADVA